MFPMFKTYTIVVPTAFIVGTILIGDTFVGTSRIEYSVDQSASGDWFPFNDPNDDVGPSLVITRELTNVSNSTHRYFEAWDNFAGGDRGGFPDNPYGAWCKNYSGFGNTPPVTCSTYPPTGGETLTSVTNGATIRVDYEPGRGRYNTSYGTDFRPDWARTIQCYAPRTSLTLTCQPGFGPTINDLSSLLDIDIRNNITCMGDYEMLGLKRGGPKFSRLGNSASTEIGFTNGNSLDRLRTSFPWTLVEGVRQEAGAIGVVVQSVDSLRIDAVLQSVEAVQLPGYCALNPSVHCISNATCSDRCIQLQCQLLKNACTTDAQCSCTSTATCAVLSPCIVGGVTDLAIGDVITHINDEAVSSDTWPAVLSRYVKGTGVVVTAVRNNTSIQRLRNLIGKTDDMLGVI